MQLFDLLQVANPCLVPEECKLHLATWNGKENPLDVFLAGDFDEWQRWQTKRNFQRKYVIALISLPAQNQWLFAGLYTAHGSEWKSDHNLHYYKMAPDVSCEEFAGRLVVSFSRTGRQSYLNAETWGAQISVAELKAERLSIAEFPGYRSINLSKGELDAIVRQSIESWRTALSNVAGVYVISDTASGKLYVGSATGEGGIWQRWSQYASTGHGGNKELRELLRETGAVSAENFRFAVLEIADIHSSEKDVLRRESHWKDVLLTREHGYNSN
ncbi:GIY-YIG nuclease family protein [Marinobacter sp.]|uniref:GIY-YIG nuclease family protein n=1 Tax=Marinobacter sp. TaxID=50741 RepID=UPI0035C72C8B